MRSSHPQVQIFQNGLQCPRLDFLCRMTGHTRNFRAENDPSVARLLYKRATLFLEPAPELTRLHVSMVTTYGYSVKAPKSLLSFISLRSRSWTGISPCR